MKQISMMMGMGLLISTAALAGGGGFDVGNGIDNAPAYTYSAWFTDSRPESRVIRYCKQISSGFGVSESQLDAQIRFAFQSWGDYAAKRANPNVFASRLEQMVRCDGTQDLTFYFGAVNPEVLKYKVRFENPTAFVHKYADGPTAWSKGFVWVSDAQALLENKPRKTWGEECALRNLQGVLLHEVGHVFGNPHIAGTIMTSNLNIDWEHCWDTKKEMTHIDWDGRVGVWLNDTYSGQFWASSFYDMDLLQEMLGIQFQKNGIFRATFKYSAETDSQLLIQFPGQTYELKIRTLGHVYTPWTSTFNYCDGTKCGAASGSIWMVKSVLIITPSGESYFGELLGGEGMGLQIKILPHQIPSGTKVFHPIPIFFWSLSVQPEA